MLTSGAILGASASCQNRAAPLPHLTEPPYYSSASTLADAIRRKQVSSEEVVRAFLNRIEVVNPKINAVIAMAADEALEAASRADQALGRGETVGPLHGVPIAVKDSIDTAGLTTTAGTLGWANRVPTRDATVVARLPAAGAIVLGKTNTPEFTAYNHTDDLVFGRDEQPVRLFPVLGW